jgi:hypothetical protein
MGIQRVTYIEPTKFLYYRVDGLGDYLARFAREPDASKRDKMAQEMLDVLYPTQEAQLLIQTRVPVVEIIGDTE